MSLTLRGVTAKHTHKYTRTCTHSPGVENTTHVTHRCKVTAQIKRNSVNYLRKYLFIYLFIKNVLYGNKPHLRLPELYCKKYSKKKKTYFIHFIIPTY